jgi:hypothetical protein
VETDAAKKTEPYRWRVQRRLRLPRQPSNGSLILLADN